MNRSLLLLLALSAAPLPAEQLAEILARMDRAAASFQSLSASMTRTEFTAVLGETSESKGSVLLKRLAGGIVGIIEFAEPDPKFVELRNRTVTVYYPKAKTAEIYDVGKFGAQLDQFLLLGFGTSGAELGKTYTISLGGTEALASGPATRIELTPKSGDAREYVTKIELWIPEGGSHPLQEKLYHKSKDHNLIVYSDLKLNPSLPDSAFKLHLPPDIKIIRSK